MPKFVVPYSIDGEIEFEAETAAEAELKFMKLGKREIADAGCLISYEAKPAGTKPRRELPAEVEAHR